MLRCPWGSWSLQDEEVTIISIQAIADCLKWDDQWIDREDTPKEWRGWRPEYTAYVEEATDGFRTCTVPLDFLVEIPKPYFCATCDRLVNEMDAFDYLCKECRSRESHMPEMRV